MNYLCRVSLTALIVAATAGAQVGVKTPVLRPGVSVQLPPTRNAVALLAADEEDAVVVAVTAQGNVYVGITRATAADLAEKVKSTQSGRAAKGIYVKGDARVPYGDMAKVLDAVRGAGIDTTALLTGQSSRPGPTRPSPPMGLEVVIGPAVSPASKWMVVRALNNEGHPALVIGNESVSLDALRAKLSQFLRGNAGGTMVLRPDEALPFGEVVSVIDTCRSTGARVFLAAAAPASK